MNMLAVTAVTALSPAPFRFAPSLALVLASPDDEGATRYVSTKPEGTDMEMLHAEARAIETVGSIDAEALGRDWVRDDAHTADLEADADFDRRSSARDDEGAEVEVEDFEEPVDPQI